MVGGPFPPPACAAGSWALVSGFENLGSCTNSSLTPEPRTPAQSHAHQTAFQDDPSELLMTGLLRTCPGTMSAWHKQCVFISLGWDSLAASVFMSSQTVLMIARCEQSCSRSPGETSMVSWMWEDPRPWGHALSSQGASMLFNLGDGLGSLPAYPTLTLAGLRRLSCLWAPMEGKTRHAIRFRPPGADSEKQRRPGGPLGGGRFWVGKAV